MAVAARRALVFGRLIDKPARTLPYTPARRMSVQPILSIVSLLTPYLEGLLLFAWPIARELRWRQQPALTNISFSSTGFGGKVFFHHAETTGTTRRIDSTEMRILNVLSGYRWSISI